MSNELEKVPAGFDPWFQDKLDPEKQKEFNLARIIIVNKERYLVHCDGNEIPAEITGKIHFNAETPLDYPAVGDWIYVRLLDDGTFAIIDEILPRKSLLRRKTPGKKIDYQVIAANIDTAFIMQSVNEDFNTNRLERYLVMIYESGIEPVIMLSKSDLLPANEVQQLIDQIISIMPGLHIESFSNLNNSGLQHRRELLRPEKTYCLLGSSGVGKTTLLNNLVGTAQFETQPIREKDSKGKHTTSRRQLITLANGAMIIDTPGMRELGNFEIETGLEITFDEISELALQCRFSDCTHTVEKGCEVLAASEDGRISQARYDNYIKMKKESEHYERSYLEKRNRDKQFGKMIKSIMKDKKKK